MNKIAAVLSATVLALTVSACSSADENISAPETVTESATVTTTAQTSENRHDEINRRLDAVTPVKQETDGNVEDHCIIAIADELPPSAGNLDFPIPIEMDGGTGASTHVYFAGGDFRYKNAQDTWVDAAYFCTVTAEDGVITESTATVA